MKSDTVRVREAIDILSRIRELGFEDDDPDVSKVRTILSDFIRGIGYSGKVYMRAADRNCIMKLSLQPHIPSVAVLRKRT
jgi:hypothetical protein